MKNKKLTPIIKKQSSLTITQSHNLTTNYNLYPSTHNYTPFQPLLPTTSTHTTPFITHYQKPKTIKKILSQYPQHILISTTYFDFASKFSNPTYNPITNTISYSHLHHTLHFPFKPYKKSPLNPTHKKSYSNTNSPLPFIIFPL